MNTRFVSMALLATLSSAALTLCAAEKLTLHYLAPANEKQWSAQALPLGNGRLGCMIFGGVASEHLQFNVDSLWTGDANPSGDYGSMGKYQNFGDLWVAFDTGPQSDDRTHTPRCESKGQRRNQESQEHKAVNARIKALLRPHAKQFVELRTY
jgi:hypothetical protein